MMKEILHEASSSRDSAPDSRTDSRGFDVFINFRGPDSRHTIADILYNTLTNAGFHVFLDDEEIRKGEVIAGELFGAITNSRIYIPIFSKDYASSKWCLRELEKMIDCWLCSSGREKKVILPIFYEVSVSEDIKLRSQVYTSALQKHKEELGEVVVKPWEDALKEVAKIKGWNLHHHGLSELAKLIKERIFSYINANEAISSVPDCLVGIHDQMEDIMQLLQDGAPDVRFIVIHGMGGIGKTTLADVVFQNISSSFQGSCILKDIRRCSSVHDMVKLQEKLLSDTLSLKTIKVFNIDDGIGTISKRLRNQKVLIVLDDVDKWDHLRNLAAKSDWFGPNSRIIITTRDIGFLPPKDNTEYCFHEMKEMDDVHALKLFYRHAFDNDCPPAEYHDISSKIVDTTGGLPLALEVIGSSLRNQDKETWKFRLDKLKEAPHKDVQERLMISYEALEFEQQQIFLDMACFFNDQKIMDPICFWEACKFYPASGIKILERRSMIKVNEHNKKLWMHDQLRDLGRAIAQPKTQDHENKFFREPSRFWSPEVALDVVRKKEVAKSIVAIELGELDDGCCFVREEFEKAVNLKFLQLQGGNFRGDFKNVFHQLRWLSWFDCPLRIKATNLSFPNLVVIKLFGSQITKDWTGWHAIMVAKQLKILRINSCPVKFLPESIGRLESLNELDLRDTGITQLPKSIGNLKRLKVINLESTKIKELPKALGELENLEELHARRCQRMQGELPEEIGKLSHLRILDLDDSEITRVPASIDQLYHLQKLCLVLREPQELPRLPSSLTDLTVYFTSAETPRLPDLSNMTNLVSLRLIHVSHYSQFGGGIQPHDGITRIDWLTRSPKLEYVELIFKDLIFPPTDLSSLRRLWKLSISCVDAKSLTHLPSSLQSLHLYDVESAINWQLLSSLKNLSSLTLVKCKFSEVTVDNPVHIHSLYLSRCALVERLLKLSYLKELRRLEIEFCYDLDRIEGLGELEFLQRLYLNTCTSIFWLRDPLRSTKLEELIFYCCDSLQTIPTINEKAPCLLCVEYCQHLRSFEGPYSDYH